MSETSAIKFEQEIPDIIQAIAGVNPTIEAYGFDKTIWYLATLRASQINGCAFCVKMHVKEARDHGETSDRLDRLVVWEHVSDFTEREKAALAWTEALTVLDKKTDYGALRARLRAHFSEKEMGVLTSLVGLVNLWNRVQVSRH